MWPNPACGSFCFERRFLRQSNNPKCPDTLVWGQDPQGPLQSAKDGFEELCSSSPAVWSTKGILSSQPQYAVSSTVLEKCRGFLFLFFLPLPKSFRSPWRKKGGTEQVIKNDQSVFQENIHSAAGTECPRQEPPCRASLNTWQASPSNVRNLRKGNISSKSFLSKSSICSFQRQSGEMLLELIQELFRFLKRSHSQG